MHIFQKLTLSILALVSFQLFAAIKISDSKDLYTIINQDYKQCSPFEGMIWWNTDLIENIYRIGNPDHATTKLVKILFKRHDDGTFDCTRPTTHRIDGVKPGNAGAYFTPKIIAEFIHLLETNKTIEQIDALKRRITDKTYVRNFLARHSQTFPADGDFLKNLQKIFRFVCDSHKECLSSNPEANYLPFTTHNILLGYLWQKSESKNDFIAYFKSFETLQPSLPIIDRNSVGSFDDIAAQHYELPELRAFFEQLDSKSANDLMQDYELAVCAILSNRPLGNVSHASGVKYTDEEFPDCGEISLLSFFDRIVMNYRTGLFDITLLEGNGAQINPKLRDFYQRNSSPETRRTKDIHHDWAKVVSEIPGIVYRQPFASETKYCNIGGEGYHQILKALKHLIGIDSFEELCKVCSRDGFLLSYKSKEPLDKQFNSFIFSINGGENFEWSCNWGHFALKILIKSKANQVLSDEVVRELLTQSHSPNACSLLALTQSPACFEKLINQKSPSLKMLNFCSLIPKIKNADENLEFLTRLAKNYHYLTNDGAYRDYIIKLIKMAYKQFPDDIVYRFLLGKLAIENRVEGLYQFVREEIRYIPSSGDVFRQRQFTTLLKKIIVFQNTELYEWARELFDIIKNDLCGESFFIEFLVKDEKNELATIDRKPWLDMVLEKFPTMEKFAQARLCGRIISENLQDWFPLVMQLIETFDWETYVPDYYEHARWQYGCISPQSAFSALLRSSHQEILDWLMTKFTYMCNQTKELALEVFCRLPQWNSWIQENFGLLKSDKLQFTSEPLEVIALKTLIEQNNQSMSQFIKTETSLLNPYKAASILEFIIEKNHEQFFDLVSTHFERLEDGGKRRVFPKIILYNRLFFYSLVEQYLETAEDWIKAEILKAIASRRYLYKDQSIRPDQSDENNYDFLSDREPETGVLVASENDSHWYPLVEKWLPQLDDNQCRSVIDTIEKNQIDALSNVASQRKKLIKPIHDMWPLLETQQEDK